jgi:excisionase family DNA binding protein
MQPTTAANVANDSIPEFLTIEEVAAVCRTSPSTVRWWQACGRLRGVKLGRRRLFDRTEVAAFIAKGSAAP